jgi:hypothetical protein
MNQFGLLTHLCMEAILGTLCIAILISTSKTTMSFLLLLMFTLQQNWEKGRTGSVWKQGGSGEREGVEQVAGGRNGPNNVCTYE